MVKNVAGFALFLSLTLGSVARAGAAPPPDMPTAAEAPVVRAIQADLNERFPTAAAAEAAGYVRYTNVDDTGAISYANRRWQSTDPRHPSQLWYDASGKLLGADLSVLKRSAKKPKRWGFVPARWSEFPAHVHYVAIDPASGAKIYDKDVSVKAFRAAGGDPARPRPATLVKLGVVKSPKDVAIVFLFPNIWDLTVWVRPNPDGAFANKNPLVTPVK